MKILTHLITLLYSWLAPLRPSADIPQVGTQKDTYGLRFAQFHYTLVDDEIHYLYAQLVTLLFWDFECMRDYPYWHVAHMRECYVQQVAHTSMRGLPLYRVAHDARVALLQTRAYLPQN